jgi:hypothetical protein
MLTPSLLSSARSGLARCLCSSMERSERSLDPACASGSMSLVADPAEWLTSSFGYGPLESATCHTRLSAENLDAKRRTNCLLTCLMNS